MKKILVLLVLVLLAVPSLAQARPGTLDPDFGRKGRVVRSADFGDRPWNVVRTQTVGLPDGRFVLLARNSLYGFAADGAIVRAFGNGEGPLPAPPGYELEATGLAADASGRVIAAGTLRAADGAEKALVVRYTASGDLDPSFGDGGVLVTDFGLPPRKDFEGVPPLTQVQVAGVAVDSQGRIVLTGTRTRMIGPCRSSTNLVYSDAFAARLDLSGDPDPGFGDKGVVRMDEIARVGSPVVDSNDGVYVTTPYGGRGPCTEPRYDRLVGHLDASGHPDPAFGDGGWVSLPFHPRTSAVTGALGPNDALLLVEDHQGRKPARKVVKVRQLLPDGNLDTTFGKTGVATISAAGLDLEAAAAAVQPRGPILVAGTATALRKPKKRSFFLGRITAGGRIGRGFGHAGLTITGWGRGASGIGSSVLLQSQRAVVAGTADGKTFGAGSGLALAGYQLGR